MRKLIVQLFCALSTVDRGCAMAWRKVRLLMINGNVEAIS